MGIVSKKIYNRKKLSFSQVLFLSVSLLSLFSIGCFIAFQYSREKEYKAELMNLRLQDFNKEMYAYIKNHPFAEEELDKLTKNYSLNHGLVSLRLTLIQENGIVIYDSQEKDIQKMENHGNRDEVLLAIRNSESFSINRVSETFDRNYFYSAVYCNDSHLIIRSSVPYDENLYAALKVDNLFLFVALLITCVMLYILFRFTKKIGVYIQQLRDFVKKADKADFSELELLTDFPDQDLGDISKHLVRIYQNLQLTKEALSVEREKLIAHLSISHEGLCVFDNSNRCILANNIFTQYSTLISDKNLTSNEQILEITEFAPVRNFLQNDDDSEERKMDFTIEKNGRFFIVECVVFQDNSYEISINDNTQEKEQSRLKQQLTQNIAHELKTPVSTIQGYLETIISNENISEDLKNQFINRCFVQSNRLANLLRDITVLTRLDEAPQMMEMHTIYLSQIINNIQKETELQLEAQGMVMKNFLPDTLTIKGNASLVYSIFRNLIDNAIAYAGKNTMIAINCFREDEKFFYFSFMDNGVGVGEEHLNRLFERFYRVDKGRSRKMGGTGLGLAIVKNAVLFHKGCISARIVPTGGLEFIFSLHK